jgi:hypothetical protein
MHFVSYIFLPKTLRILLVVVKLSIDVDFPIYPLLPRHKLPEQNKFRYVFSSVDYNTLSKK